MRRGASKQAAAGEKRSGKGGAAPQQAMSLGARAPLPRPSVDDEPANTMGVGEAGPTAGPGPSRRLQAPAHSKAAAAVGTRKEEATFAAPGCRLGGGAGPARTAL